MVEFYAPTCGHCSRLALPWASAAETVNAAPYNSDEIGSNDFHLAKVDCLENEELYNRFEIEGECPGAAESEARADACGVSTVST